MWQLITQRVPYTVFAIAFGTLLSRLGTSMVIPYVTLLIVQIKHLSIYWAGWVIAGSYLAQAFGTSLVGGLLKRTPSFNILKTTIIIYSCAFVTMGLISIYIDKPQLIAVFFICGFLVIGICRSLIETLGQTIISQTTTAAQKYFAFSLRYTFINIGVSLGPLIALMLGILNSTSAFFVTALFVLFYFLLLEFTVNLSNQHHDVEQRGHLMDTCKLLLTDKKLLFFLITTFLCYVGFSQMETLFALVSYQMTGSNHTFVVMYAINGMTIIFLQMPIVRLIKRFNIHYVIMSGVILLSLGLLGIALANHNPFLYYFSMIIFTFGEILSLSIEGIYIDQLTATENKFLYFGVNNFSLVGRIIGPPLAAMLCQHWGLHNGLIMIAFLTTCGVVSILLANRMPKLTMFNLMKEKITS